MEDDEDTMNPTKVAEAVLENQKNLNKCFVAQSKGDFL